MKKIVSMALALCMATSAFATAFAAEDAVDYSDRNNWLAFEENPTQAADVFYVYPTVNTEGELVDINDETMRTGALASYYGQAGILQDDFNCYAPYYRQLAGMYEMNVKSIDQLAEEIKSHKTIEDIYAALDYYFTNVNPGAVRPYILAGHSQGSCVLRVVLEDYMAEHPDYYKQMIAAYAIGMGFGSEWLAKNPHVKTATGADDTGVLICWNTEGPGASGENILLDTDTYLINPLTWTTDDTYAGKEKNLGSLTNPMDPTTLVTPGENDAQIDPERHALICTTKDSYMGVFQYFFGDKCLHAGDWGFYLTNIKENAINRRDIFLKAANG